MNSLKVATLHFSVNNYQKFVPIMASINTLKKEMAACDYVAHTFIENRKRQKNLAMDMRVNPGTDTTYLESAVCRLLEERAIE